MQKLSAKAYYWQKIYPYLKENGLDVESRYQKFFSMETHEFSLELEKTKIKDFVSGRHDGEMPNQSYYENLKKLHEEIKDTSCFKDSDLISSLKYLHFSNSYDLNMYLSNIISANKENLEINDFLNMVYVYKHGMLSNNAEAPKQTRDNSHNKPYTGTLIRFDTGLMAYIGYTVGFYTDFLLIYDAMENKDDVYHSELLQESHAKGQGLLRMLEIWEKEIVVDGPRYLSTTTFDSASPGFDLDYFGVNTALQIEIEKFVLSHEISHCLQHKIDVTKYIDHLTTFSEYQNSTKSQREEFRADALSFLLMSGLLSDSTPDVSDFRSAARSALLFMVLYSLLYSEPDKSSDAHPSLLDRFSILLKLYKHFYHEIYTPSIDHSRSLIFDISSICEFSFHISSITQGRGIGINALYALINES
jgi:hypothetical protein